jgi:hypothetical protein
MQHDDEHEFPTIVGVTQAEKYALTDQACRAAASPALNCSIKYPRKMSYSQNPPVAAMIRYTASSKAVLGMMRSRPVSELA